MNPDVQVVVDIVSSILDENNTPAFDSSDKVVYTADVIIIITKMKYSNYSFAIKAMVDNHY